MLKLPPVFRFVSCLLAMLAVLSLSACSTSKSSVRELAERTETSSAEGVKLAFLVDGLQTSSQEGGGLYTLHSSRQAVNVLAERLGRFYGFEVVEPEQAEFILELKQTVPDGGACSEGVEAAEVNASYTLSLLTLGAFPATKFFCLLVVADLYEVRDGERIEMGEFFSNEGVVEAYGSINALKSYQLSVEAQDEVKGLETSLGALISEVIQEGAFDR